MATWELRFVTVGLLFVGCSQRKVYVDKPEPTDALKTIIREAIGEIQLHTTYNVFKTWMDRVGYYMASRGCHINELFSIINRKDCTFK